MSSTISAPLPRFNCKCIICTFSVVAYFNDFHVSGTGDRTSWVKRSCYIRSPCANRNIRENNELLFRRNFHCDNLASKQSIAMMNNTKQMEIIFSQNFPFVYIRSMLPIVFDGAFHVRRRRFLCEQQLFFSFRLNIYEEILTNLFSLL